MTDAIKKGFAEAISILDEALETSKGSDDISIGDTTISRQEAEKMKTEFEFALNNEVQIDKKVFKIIPIKLAIVDYFWRNLLILVRDEYLKNLKNL